MANTPGLHSTNPPHPQPHKCNLTHHDTFLSSKNRSTTKNHPDFPTCTHCRKDWTHLLKPEKFEPRKTKNSQSPKPKLNLDTIVQKTVAKRLQDRQFRVAISHFCGVAINEKVKFLKVGLLERFLGKGEDVQKRVREQSVISLLHSFYKDLYFESYTYITYVVNGQTPNTTITDRELKELKRKKVESTEFLMMIEIAAWFSHSKLKMGSWDKVYEAYGKKMSRSDGGDRKVHRTAFIRGSRALESLREGLRGLRSPILVGAVEVI